MTHALTSTAPASLQEASFTLHPIPPFRLDLTVWVLRRRPENTLDRWDGQTWRRALVLNGAVAEIAVQQVGPPASPKLVVTARAKSFHAQSQLQLRETVERVLGTQIDLANFYSLARRQKHLQPLITAFVGFKPPRYPSVFEALLNAITCQQVSLHVGMMLLNRLVQNFGKSAPAAEGHVHACPLPEDLASLSTGRLRAMGFSRQKERAILELSRALAARELNLEQLSQLDNAAAFERLCAIRGIGRWSAEYALLRGLGRLGVFPGDDVGGWNRIQKHFRLRKRPDYAKVRKLLAPWKEYAGLLYFHFLLDGIRERGILA